MKKLLLGVIILLNSFVVIGQCSGSFCNQKRSYSYPPNQGKTFGAVTIIAGTTLTTLGWLLLMNSPEIKYIEGTTNPIAGGGRIQTCQILIYSGAVMSLVGIPVYLLGRKQQMTLSLNVNKINNLAYSPAIGLNFRL